MASEGMEIPKDIQREEKLENQVHRRKRFLLQRLGLLWQKNPVQEKRRKSNSY